MVDKLASPILRVLGYGLGLALIILAVYEGVTEVAPEKIINATRLELVGIAVAVLANLVLTGVFYWGITTGFDANPPLGLGRMTGLISISSLLNYLPLRPGLVSRVMFLKVHHGVPIRQSLVISFFVVILSAIISASVVLLGLCGAVYSGTRGISGQVIVPILGLIIVTCVCSLMPLVARRMAPQSMQLAWLLPVVKTLDILAGGMRFWLALRVVGLPLTYSQSLVAAAGGMLVSLIGLTPNGLGIREWTVTGVLVAMTAVDSGYVAMAAVIERGIEVMVMVPCGLISFTVLRKDLAGKAFLSKGDQR